MSSNDPIPDGWPIDPSDLPTGDSLPTEERLPSGEGAGPSPESFAQVAPMFPLPRVFLHPRQLMPLNIFEPRYRSMIEDSLDGPGRLVIGTILEESSERLYDEEHPPEILPVAGIGEIARHERTADGRFHIWLFGLGRVAVEELPRETPYRQVRATPLLETAADPDEAERLREPLERAILARTSEVLNLPDDMPTDMLVDLLSPRINAPQPELERIFMEPDVVLRARLALRAHAGHPPTDDSED